jgi:ribosomal protein S18 acetylase RimI-like enzyme
MHIVKVSEVTEELYKAFLQLIPQLGKHKIPPTRDELKKLVNSESSILLVAQKDREDDQIVGTLCLTIYRVPTGVRSIIEDLIVDEKARRQGVGQALIQYAITLAREAGAVVVTLTSNPLREAANQFYRSMGFELRNTNSYLYRLK